MKMNIVKTIFAVALIAFAVMDGVDSSCPNCQNGGTLIAMCRCPSGWTGNECRTPICTPSCQNGGTCTKPGVCACPSGWTGSRCTINDGGCSPSCPPDGFCDNGKCICLVCNNPDFPNNCGFGPCF